MPETALLVTPRKSSGRTGLLILSAAVVLGAAFALPRPARADNIDERLYRESPRLIGYLEGHGYQRVGVLKFRVKKGNGKASFSVGDLNVNMPKRLENALILRCDPTRRLRILPDASQVVADRHAGLSYLDAADRRQMFACRYAVAGDGARVAADAFLTGLVEISPDKRRTTVTVEGFDRKSSQLEKVLTFSVPTDRSILDDLGESYRIASRDLKRHDVDEDEEAIKSTQTPEPSRTDPPPGPDDTRVELKVLYDGQPQEISRPPSASEERVASPGPGQRVTFSIKNVSSEPVGVVLKVNGINTLLEQADENNLCAKWVLDPKEETTVQGFYRMEGDRKVIVPFSVLDDEASSREQQSLRSPGLIQLAVFTRGGGQSSADRILSLRGLSHRQLELNPPRSFADYRARLLAQAHLQKSRRGLIVKDPTTPTAPAGLKQVDFGESTCVGNRTIRYYDPQGSGASTPADNPIK